MPVPICSVPINQGLLHFFLDKINQILKLRLAKAAGFPFYDSLLIYHKGTRDGLSGKHEESEKQIDAEREDLRRKLNMSVNEIELSVRAANCLNKANLTTVGELAGRSEQNMLKYRNFGKKSLNEIKDKLEELGLSLGMKFDPSLLDKPIGDEE